VNDHAGVVNDHAGVVNDCAGVVNDCAGVVNDHVAVVNDHVAVVNDCAGAMNDCAGVANDWEGGMHQIAMAYQPPGSIALQQRLSSSIKEAIMAKVYGCWEFRLRPGVTEAEFEQAARELVAHPGPAGWHGSFGKADRGTRLGTYLFLMEIESVEVRDEFATAEGFTAIGEQWFADNPGWNVAYERLTALALEPEWADYVVFASE
jgi:hypothetical protein